MGKSTSELFFITLPVISVYRVLPRNDNPGAVNAEFTAANQDKADLVIHSSSTQGERVFPFLLHSM